MRLTGLQRNLLLWSTLPGVLLAAAVLAAWWSAAPASFDWRVATAWAVPGLVLLLFGAWRIRECVAKPAEAAATRLHGEDSADPQRAELVEINRHAAAAQAAEQAKARFLAVVGDRLRQPLQAMNLFIGALRRDASAAQLPAIERLHEVAQAMGGILDELLELARLDARVVAVVPTECDLHELFAAQRHRFAAPAQARGVSLHWHAAGATVHGDADLLDRVLHHLIANAIDHAPRGRVLVAARRCPRGIRIEVRDNGVGIARIQQAQIFEEFAQLHAGGRRERRLGLGLPICSRLARLLGSRIGLRSEPGRGSVFSIELPRAAASIGVIEGQRVAS